MIHFGIIHATQRAEPTLHACIASLNECGAQSIAVMPDNGTWGTFKNWNRAMEHLLTIAKPGDSVCVLDDDFVLHRDALIILGQSPNPDAIHILFTVEQNIEHNLRGGSGWIDNPVGWGSWGGGIVFPLEAAERHVKSPFYRRHLLTFRNGRHIDAANFETIRLNGDQVLHHLPSLADHIGGHSSTLNNDHGSETRGFRFNEWN